MFLNNSYKDKYLHIISFDIPVPVNYGGAIDVFYKLKALHGTGVKVILHCYEYDRKPAVILNQYCEKVYYYKREVNKSHLFKLKPYIVATRNSNELLKNLLKDNYPILFEGLHSCYFLSHSSLKNRKKIVRTHNVEHHYYGNLAKAEKDLFKKYYFYNEAAKLKSFEKILKHAQGIACISKNDYVYFSDKYSNTTIVSAFHPHEKVDIKEGYGKFALYHGSLDVPENNEAALFLVQKVFRDIDIPLVIAGNKISKELKALESSEKNLKIISSLNTEDIYELVKTAHVNILPTFQATGIKLKLLAALYTGRYCVVNSPMVINTGLEDLCIIQDDVEAMKTALKNIFEHPFSSKEIEKREFILNNNGFSNNFNCIKLLKLVFD
ncbi:MAG: glycosyltransferase [Bacteroidales bacterium]|nr:glycosyltransferase [Bacteroidales bacterium]